LVALPPISLSIAAGDFIVITGPSGSGKSTLLNILSGLDRPSSGDVEFRGQSLLDLDDAALAALRNTSFGFVFQTPHTLPYRTVFENVMLPFQYGPPTSAANMKSKVIDLLDYVGLRDFAQRYPNTLSVGEQQRLVFARALVREPEVILADEPTGSLDGENSRNILGLLRDQADRNRTILMVTHDEEAMQAGTRHIHVDKFN